MKKIVKTDIRAFGVSVILFLILLATDHLVFDFHAFILSRYIGIKIVYLVILTILGQLAKSLLLLAKKDKAVLKAIGFSSICIAFLMACLIITYPGIWVWIIWK